VRLSASELVELSCKSASHYDFIESRQGDARENRGIRLFSMEEIGSSGCPRSFNSSRAIVPKNYIMETACARVCARGRGAIKVQEYRGSSVEISISVERGAGDAET